MAVLPRANDALDINPPLGVDLTLSEHGSDFLWAVTAVYIVSFVSSPTRLTRLPFLKAIVFTLRY